MKMDVQKEISLRNAISYCIENNDVNTATNRIMEFIRDEKEALTIPVVVGTLCDCDIPIKTTKDSEGQRVCKECYNRV
jgi:hypothetical protein